MGQGPPSGVAPARLFRLLLRHPRPWLSIDLSIDGVDGGFVVFAPRPAEIAEAHEAAEGLPARVGGATFLLEIAARCLFVDGERAVRNADELANALEGDEVDKLLTSANQALCTIGPWVPYSDFGAWVNRLREGATHPTNVLRARTLSASVDTSMTGITGRPDRFFGVPGCDLTDGQWMAFRACREAFEKNL